MKILRFTAEWCQPCKNLAKTLSELDSEIPIEVIDIDSVPGIAEQYKIRSVPTLMITEGTGEISRLVGAATKEKIQSWIKTYQTQ